MFRTCTVAMGMVVVKDMLQTTYVGTSVVTCVASASGLRVLRTTRAARTDCTHSCSSLC